MKLESSNGEGSAKEQRRKSWLTDKTRVKYAEKRDKVLISGNGAAALLLMRLMCHKAAV